MISNSNLKSIFTIIALKLYSSFLIKYWKILYYIFWWNLKNLVPVTFKIFLKRLEFRYNVSKNFFILNTKLKFKQQTRFLKNDEYINIYLDDFLVRYNNPQILMDDTSLFELDTLLSSEVYLETDYTFYYNFYSLRYLN